MRRTAIGIRAGAVIGLAYGLTLGLAAPASAASSVAISGLAYVPPSLTVPAGTTVTWTNMDSGIPHSVTSDTGAFDSSPTCNPSATAGCLATGASFSNLFSTAGTFAYHCHIHSFMHGTITVTSTAPSTTSPPTTAPPTTAPPATSPPTTAPLVTAPPATSPPTTARSTVAALSVGSSGLARTGPHRVIRLAEFGGALMAAGLLVVVGAARRRSRP
jgi:plastocyanin